MRRALIQALQLETTAQWLDRILPAQDLLGVLQAQLQKRFSDIERVRLANSNPRVFVAVKHHNWEQAGLIDSWADVAETVAWDWSDQFDQHAADWHKTQKQAFNRALLKHVTEAHATKPLTHFFSYLSGRWVYPQTVEQIGRLGIITINFSFDDSHRYWGKRRQGLWTGIASIAPAYDLNITAQNPADTAKYRLSGARALYLPPGGNPQAFSNLVATEKRYFASFVGQCYGVRREFVSYLRAAGIEVHTWGKGWPEGSVNQQEMLEIYAASQIILGFGYVGSSRKRTAIKGRDFEIPLTGSAYMTSFNQELGMQFEDSKEILMYRNPAHAVKLLESLRNSPEELTQIGKAGKKKALEKHTWQKRWEHTLSTLRNALYQGTTRNS